MHKVLLAGVAALSLLAATGTAHATDTCAEVNAPVDTDGSPGKLNLREKPNTKSKIRMQILAGNILMLDVDPTIDLFEDWVHVTAAISVDGGGQVHIEDGPNWYGWASKKYLKPVECPTENEAPGVGNKEEAEHAARQRTEQDTEVSAPSPQSEEAREDWCRRNDWDNSAVSCKGLTDKKPWPKWLMK